MEFDSPDFETMKRRNAWIDNVATLVMFIGFVAPLVLIHSYHGSVFWIFGLMFGDLVIGHISSVSLITLPMGATRFREYWRYYDSRWRVGISGMKFLYIPICLVWLVSAWNIWA